MAAPLNALQRARALAALEDTLACVVAGLDAPEVRLLRLAIDQGGVEAQALLWGVAAHALDFDDNFGPALTHASAVLVPTLLLLAAEEGASGDDVLRAYIVGLELQARIGRAIQPRHYQLGWHSTSTLGVIGAAGAAAALIDGRASAVAAALSIAVSMAGGARQQFGTPMKPVHAGLAARNSVLAARMAAAGLAGADPFAGPWGIGTLFAGGSDRAVTLPEPGEPTALERDGVLAKRFACCGAMHRSLDGIEVLREGLSAPDEVAEVVLRMPPTALANLRYDRPSTPAEARFSATFCAAEMLLTGTAGLSSFTPERLAASPIRAWLPRMRTVADGNLPLRDDGSFDAVTTVVLHDGTERSVTIGAVRGSAASPFSPEERHRKVQDCCAWFGQPALAAELCSAVESFHEAAAPRRLRSMIVALDAEAAARSPERTKINRKDVA